MKKAGLFIFLFYSSLLLFSQEETGLPPAEPAAENTAEAADGVAEADGAEADGAEAAEAVEEKKERTAADKGMDPASVLDRDINTATVQELADWCRSLGLSGDGGKEALAVRLREYYKLEKPPETPAATGEKEPLIITIESAKTTEYFTVESVNEEYVRLRGGVSVTLKDGDTLHKIQAEEILYNRTKEMMTASGGVTYVKTDAQQGAGEETTFTGAGITVNLNNWSTAFMQGVSDRAVGDGTTYRFSGEVISRSGDDSIVLRKARITNPAQEEPYWSIDASRLWLLPGSDFAILNAVIKVGEIPVLYFPAFYYPGSEVIFRPVLGIRSREGTFLQTTTYILGRPKTTTSSSSEERNTFSSFLGSTEGMETKREGIFLRSTGRKAPSTTEPIFYLMADAYSNLGYFLGSELTLPPKKRFGQMLFSAGLGFSRDISTGTYGYTPFDYDGTSNWHRSRLLNYDIPFPLRYRFIGTGSVSASGTVVRSANLSWNLPLYSDPYVDNDFINYRSMDSNIFDLLKTANKVDTTINETYVSFYNWQLNGGLSFATTLFNPYITDLSISSAAMSVNFATRLTNPPPAQNLSVPPNRQFFYPDKFTLFSVSAGIGGTLLNLGGEAQKKTENKEAEIVWGEPFSPWDSEETEKDKESEDPLALHPSSFARSTSSVILGGHRFTLNYKITPSASSEIKFNSNNINQNWRKAEDVDWSDWAHQFFSYRIDGTMSMTLSEKRNLYNHGLTFEATKSGQNYLFLNSDASEYRTEDQRKYVEERARVASYFKSTGKYNFTLTPFIQSEVWKNTNLQYNLQGFVFEKKYDTDSKSEIEEWAEWTQEKITTNRLQANISANVMEKAQTLNLTAELPPKNYDKQKTTTPRVTTFRGALTLNAWISRTSIDSSVEDPFEIPYYNAINIGETLQFPKNITLTHNMQYVPENRDDNPRKPNGPEKPGLKTLTTTLNSNQSWGTLSGSFRAQRSKSYNLNTTPGQEGWKIDPNTEDKFNPQSLSMSFNTNRELPKWRDFSGRVNLTTSLNFNLQQYTESKFDFSLSTTMRINNFLVLTLQSVSDNKQIYRYFRNMPFFDPLDIDIPGEKNILIDLANSFRFDDIEKRRASGFKLRSLNLDLTHHLGDWDATLTIKLFPELNTSKRVYEFKTRLDFVVKWMPIKEFKTEILYTNTPNEILKLN